MGTAITIVCIATGAIGAIAASPRGVGFDTIGVIVTLAGLLGGLVALVCWDSWQPTSRPTHDAGRNADAELADSPPAPHRLDH